MGRLAYELARPFPVNNRSPLSRAIQGRGVFDPDFTPTRLSEQMQERNDFQFVNKHFTSEATWLCIKEHSFGAS